MLGVAAVGTGGVIKALVVAHATAGVCRFGYVGGKRYLKLLAAFSGTHGTGPPVAEYRRAEHARAAEELDRLPNGSVVVEMICDYAVMREQVRACRR